MYRMVPETDRQSVPPLVTDRPQVVVGRATDCDWVLAGPGVRDRHAAIETRPDGYYLVALDDPSSVRVNGVAVRAQRLRTGDEVELGGVRLRFEVVHGVNSTARRPSLLSGVAAVIVALLGLGQLAVVAWIFSQPRSRQMRVQASKQVTSEPPGLIADENPAALRPAGTAPLPASAPPSAALATETGVFPRMIDLLQVERSDSADGVLVKVVAKAQVGAREFDVSAAAVAVVAYGVDEKGRTVPRGQPLWLKLPAWENFTVKTLAARFAGAPAEYAGFVVWSFYRGQPQDVAAVPPLLLSLARAPPQ